MTGKIERDDLPHLDLETTGRVRMKHVHSTRRGTTTTGRGAADEKERRAEDGGRHETTKQTIGHLRKHRGVGRRRIGFGGHTRRAAVTGNRIRPPADVHRPCVIRARRERITG